jgi:hypothetical protein
MCRGSSFLSSFALLGALSACGMIPGLEGSDDGGASGPNGAASATADAGPKGIDCITEAETGAVICTGISSCPGLLVNHDVFPTCGFRVGGALLDLECACQGSLCPIGVAQTCEQAKQLLRDQTESTVCMQVAEGRCTKGTPATTTPATSSSCDKLCAAECGNVPSCIKLCGC